MLTPAPDVDARALAHEFELDGLVQFIPLGEDSYLYRCGSKLVRLEPARDGDLVARALRASREMPFDFVLKPVSIREWNGYTAAVFPFVEGRAAGPPDAREIAECLQQLHAAVSLDLPWVEQFANPFRPQLDVILQSGLLDQQQMKSVRGTIQAFDESVAQLKNRPISFVPTHGDPNTSNWIIDAHGEPHLCDWGGLGLGPRERDLFAFAEPDLQNVWTEYGLDPDENLLEFYRLRWILQEVADYGSRLLDPNLPSEEREHARRELDRYTA